MHSAGQAVPATTSFWSSHAATPNTAPSRQYACCLWATASQQDLKLTRDRVGAMLRRALLVQLQLVPQKLHGSCKLAHHHLQHAACISVPGGQVQQGGQTRFP